MWGTAPIFQKIGGESEQGASERDDYFFYFNDQRGAPCQMVDGNGRTVWQATYDAFGKAKILVDEVENNFRLPGQYFDAESGLHYNWHRYYEPETGRYLTVDPLRDGMNYYAYCGGDPLGKVDPWGLAEKEVTSKKLPLIGAGLYVFFGGEFTLSLAWDSEGRVGLDFEVATGAGLMGSLSAGKTISKALQWIFGSLNSTNGGLSEQSKSPYKVLEKSFIKTKSTPIGNLAEPSLNWDVLTIGVAAKDKTNFTLPLIQLGEPDLSIPEWRKNGWSNPLGM